MPFIQSDQGKDEGRFLPRGLLVSEGEWTLPLGVSQVRPLRHLGRAGLGGATALLACWIVTLWLEAWGGQGDWPKVILACLFGLAWASVAIPMWRSLSQAGVVTLRWGGLPPFKPLSDGVGDFPGWSLPSQAQSVSVHVVFDLGPWLLIKMAPVNVKTGSSDTWSWLDSQVFFASGANHHLRALLFNRRANLVGVPKADAGVDPATVASSRNPQRQWSNLLPLPPKPLQVAGQHARQPDKAFADTVIDERRIRA